MRMKCAVKNCNNSNKSKPCTISFFSFPSDPNLAKRWRSFCGRGKEMNPKTSQICMEHFKPEDFENELQFKLGFTKRRLLKSGAVPSVRKLSTAEEERHKRLQKRENKKIVEMLIKEHDEKSVEPKENNKPKPAEQLLKTEILEKHELNPETELISECQKEHPLKTNYDYKMEIERLRTENYLLKESSKKQAIELNALKLKGEKQQKNYESNLNRLNIVLTKTKYELKNLEEKLLVIFTEGQIAKLKGGDKRKLWSEEDLSQALTLYETSPKLYKLLYRKKFPLPAVRTVQVWRRKNTDLEKEINRFLEKDVNEDLRKEIVEDLEKELTEDIDHEIEQDQEIETEIQMKFEIEENIN